MNTNNEAMLSMEEFHTQMTQQADRFAAVTALQNKLRFGRGMNQTLAMECEDLRPGFITSSNPIAGFSVQPSKTNLSLTLEELDKVKVGLLAAAVAIGSAILWKIIQWYKKWRGNGSDSGSSGSGDSGSSSSGAGYISPERANKVITNGIDTLTALEGIKKDLIASAGKGNAMSSTEIIDLIKEINVKSYESLGNSLTILVDQFITNSGLVAMIVKLHETSLKEAPTKLRDAFNKVEQHVTAFLNANTEEGEAAEVAKLVEMYELEKDKKSFWMQNAGDIPEGKTVVDATNALKEQAIHLSDTEKSKSNLGTELKNNPNGGFILKLRQGVHGAYEKLQNDMQRLSEEVDTDLRAKVTSLEKQAGANNITDKTDTSHFSDFTKAFRDIIVMLNLDISAIGNMIAITGVICAKYGKAIEMITANNAACIHHLIGLAETLKAKEVKIALKKIQVTNDTLVKGVKKKYGI